MSEKETTQSRQNIAGKTHTDPSPCLKRNTGRDEPATGSMVIPAVLAIALAVVVVATFFEDEYNSLLAVLGLSDYDSTPVVLASEESAKDTGTSDTGGDTPNLDQTSATVAVTAIEQIDESATIDADPTPPAEAADDKKSMTSPGLAPEASAKPASTYTSPYFASSDYSMPHQANNVPYPDQQRGMIANQREIWKEIEDQRRKDREEMMESRRQAWLEAEAARREHLANMHIIRTAVLKRIDQGRTDTRRQIQEMNEEMDKRREEEETHMMELHRRADGTAI